MPDAVPRLAEALSYEAIEMNREFGPWKYPLADRIARHLEAVENQHSWHRERSPWGPPVAPPSILGNAGMRFLDQVGPVPPGTLHVKQEIETISALRLDRQLIGYGKFTAKYEKRGRNWFVFETRWRDETGLMIGNARLRMAFPPEQPLQKRGTRNKEQAAGQSQAGEGPAAITRTLTQERITAYSEDSANAERGMSIHVQPEAAKKAGFPTTVAQGLMAADYISEMMELELGREWYADARLSLAFLKPMLCGETITARARLAEATPEGAVIRRRYEARCENQAGEQVAAGETSALVMRSEPGEGPGAG